MLLELLVFVIAFIAAILGPILGIGGGTVFIPILDMLSGLKIKEIIALSSILGLTLSLRSNARYFKQGIINIRFGTTLIGFTVLGSFVGALVMIAAPQIALRIAFGIVLIYVSLRMFKKEPVRSNQSTCGERLFTDKYYDKGEGKVLEYAPCNLKVGIPLMFLGGFASGLFGIGGGIVYVPVFIMVFLVTPRIAVTMSSFLISFSATISSFVYLISGLVKLDLAAYVVAGALLGATIGSKLAMEIKNEILKRLIAVFFSVVAIQMILEALVAG